MAKVVKWKNGHHLSEEIIYRNLFRWCLQTCRMKNARLGSFRIPNVSQNHVNVSQQLKSPRREGILPGFARSLDFEVRRATKWMGLGQFLTALGTCWFVFRLKTPISYPMLTHNDMFLARPSIGSSKSSLIPVASSLGQKGGEMGLEPVTIGFSSGAISGDATNRNIWKFWEASPGVEMNPVKIGTPEKKIKDTFLELGPKSVSRRSFFRWCPPAGCKSPQKKCH